MCVCKGREGLEALPCTDEGAGTFETATKQTQHCIPCICFPPLLYLQLPLLLLAGFEDVLTGLDTPTPSRSWWVWPAACRCPSSLCPQGVLLC